MKLGNIASIRSGLVLSRKQARESSEMRYVLLNLRSINPDGYIDLEQTDVFDATERLNIDYLTQVGDIVVRLTVPYTAILIDETTQNMVVSSNFVIIRAERQEILPEYLVWLLNTSQIKRDIYENSSSNMLSAIKAKYFSELDIILPSMQEQKKIAMMNELAKKESRLLRKLSHEKRRYYDLLIDRIYDEIKRGNEK